MSDSNYSRGDAMTLDERPGVVIEDLGRGNLRVSTFPGQESLIGDRHSGLSPVVRDSSVWVERIREIRDYFGITTESDREPWRSRRNPELRAKTPDAFPEAILTWGVDYRPRTN